MPYRKDLLGPVIVCARDFVMSTYKALGLKKGGSAFSYWLAHVKAHGTSERPVRRLVRKTIVKSSLAASTARWTGTQEFASIRKGNPSP